MAAPLSPEQQIAIESSAPAQLYVVPEPGELADYGLEVVDWISHKPVMNPTEGVGKIATHIAIMSDGSRNVVREVEASERKFETPFCFSTPLATRVNGINTYTAIQAAKRGMDSLIVGAPQVWPDAPLQSHEAYVFAKLVEANYSATRQGLARVVLGGYSWAAMRAPAEAQYLSWLGIDVPFIKSKDACLAEKTGLAETKRDMTLPYVAAELVEGAKSLISKDSEDSWLHGARRLGHMAGTGAISLPYFLTHGRVARQLWEGEAGSFVAHTPANTALLAHFMEHSPFNDYETYRDAIALHPHGRSILEQGVHFTPSRRDIIRSYVGQVAYGQQLVEQGASAAELAEELDTPLGIAA